MFVVYRRGIKLAPTGKLKVGILDNLQTLRNGECARNHLCLKWFKSSHKDDVGRV